MSQKTILILGGSYAGVATAHYLLKHVIPSLAQIKNYKIVLVSTSSHFFVRPTSPRGLTSENAFPKDDLFVPLTKAFSQYDSSRIQLVTGIALCLDHENRSVTVCVPEDNTEQKIEYHALIIATGATATSPLFGLFGEHTRTEEAWKELRKKLPTAKTIIIAGAGPTGVETAGELGQYLNGRAGLFGGGSNKAAITIVTKSSQILPELPLPLAKKAETQLAKLGVSVITNRKIAGVTPPDAGVIHKDGGRGGDLTHITDSVEITLDNDELIKADLYIPATGVSPNTSFIDKVLLDSEGYVNVDSTLRVQNGAGPRVYAIGHVSSSQPRAIHAIMNQTPVLCENLKRDLLAVESGQDEDSTGYRELAAETKKSQLVVIGGGGVGLAFGWKIPGFLVWLIKGRDYWLGMTPGMWNGKQFDKAG